MILFADTETYSSVPIREGVHAYSDAEDAEIMIVTWAVDDGPVITRDLTAGDRIGDFYDAVRDADRIVFHNSMFDRTILRKLGQLDIPAHKIYDTMVNARCHALPGALGLLCDIFKVPSDSAKDKRGKELIQMFCKPQPKNTKLRRKTRDTHPQEWQQFLDYAGNDILAMRHLYKVMPKWSFFDNSKEHALWVLDQRINDRGFGVDADLIDSAVRAVDDEKYRLKQRAQELTEYDPALDQGVESATKRDQLLRYTLAEFGISLPDLRANTLERRIADEDVPEPLKELLCIRLQASSSSSAKFKRALKVASQGRIRGALSFAGAGRTQRWSGSLFQPQNLMRPNMSEEDIELFIDALKGGVEELVSDNVMKGLANCTRGIIVPAPGNKLVVSDLSNIEGRVLAWLAGEDWKLEAFAAFDRGEGPDLYYVTASMVLGKPADRITKLERQTSGKVPELACLAGDTLVLTNLGPVAIKDISTAHKLWDGKEWVAHAGLIDRGEKATIPMDGVSMTPDHLVLADTWRAAQTVGWQDSYLFRAREIGLASLLSLASNTGHSAEFVQSVLPVLAELNRTKFTSAIYEKGRVLGAPLVLKDRNAKLSSVGSDMLQSFLTKAIGGGSAIASPLATTGATTLTIQDIKTMGEEASRFTSRGAWIEPFISRTSLRLTGGISQNLNSIGSTSIKATNPATFGSSPDPSTPEIDVKYNFSSTGSMNLKRVYDIADAGPRNQFTVLTDNGALIVHNCGYQGALGAFGKMAALYGLDLSDRAVLKIVKDWRAANPQITSWWHDLEEAAREAILNPGVTIPCRKVKFRKQGAWLRIIMPGGTSLTYASPRIDEEGKVSYMGLNSYTRKWERIRTYGGKWAENITQHVARCIMAENLGPIEEAGYAITLLVHDETVTEAPDEPEYNAEALSILLATKPDWPDIETLPLAAAGHEMYRYAKKD